MKKRVIVSLLMAFAAITFISAQDVDEILDNYFENIGQNKLLKVKSVHFTGKAMMTGMESTLVIISKRPDKMRIELEIQDAKIVQAYDGVNAWMINPMTGSEEPIDLIGPDADGMIESSDMDGQLWNYKEKGHQLELDGTEGFEGSDVYVLKLTKKNGSIDHYYLDSDNYVVLMVKSIVVMNGSEIETETIFSNFQDVNGVIMPFTFEYKYAGQTGRTIIMEEIKFDQTVDDTIFAKPPSEE
jgi:outer membrane lipoprotein-sorting protein